MSSGKDFCAANNCNICWHYTTVWVANPWPHHHYRARKKKMGIIFLQQTVQQTSKNSFKPVGSTALSLAPLIRLEKFRESVIISTWPLLSDHNKECVDTHTAGRIFVPSIHCSRRHDLIIKSSCLGWGQTHGQYDLELESVSRHLINKCWVTDDGWSPTQFNQFD